MLVGVIDKKLGEVAAVLRDAVLSNTDSRHAKSFGLGSVASNQVMTNNYG